MPNLALIVGGPLSEDGVDRARAELESWFLATFSAELVKSQFPRLSQRMPVRTVVIAPESSRPRKNSIGVLQQSPHDRTTPVYSMTVPLVLKFLKNERMVFQHRAGEMIIGKRLAA